MKFAAVHHKGVITDEYPLRACMKVDSVIEVYLSAEMHVGGLSNADIIFNY
jgi:hypothetical protein